MKFFKFIFVSLVFALLLACGTSKKDSFFSEDKPAEKVKVVNQTNLTRHWKVNLDGDIDSSAVTLSPILRGDNIYAAATKGKVYKINAARGDIEWQTNLKDKITAGVGVGSGLVLVGTEDGLVYALKQEDGSIAWQAQLSSEILASPVVEDDVVVVRAVDGKIYGLAAYKGKIIWTISRQIPRLTLRGDSKPLIYQNIVFAGFSDGTLLAFELGNGRALWDFPISFPRGTSELDRLVDIDTTPLLVGNFIYVSSYQQVTHAINIKRKRIEWSADISSYHSLAYDAANLYITDKQGVVHQLLRSNGDKIWSQKGLRLHSVSAPISQGAYVLVADGDGGLYVIDKASGSFISRHSLGADNIVGEPITNAGNVYFIDTDGDLQSLSIVKK